MTTRTAIEPRMLTAAQVAQRMNISTSQLRRLVKSGDVPAPRCFGPRCHRWDSLALEEYLDGGACANDPIDPFLERLRGSA